MKRGETRPATVKLSKFSAALGQLRDQLLGKKSATTEPEVIQTPTVEPSTPTRRPQPRPHRKKQQLPSDREVPASPGHTAQPDFIARRKEVARRLRQLLATTVSHVEQRPTIVSSGTAETVTSAVARGAEIMSERPGPDFDGYIIGFDLGTSSVKCAYRQPYVAGDLVRSISAPNELRSFAHPCLWQTVLWFDPTTKHFSLLPTKGAVAIDGFKSGLIRDDGRAWAADGVHITKAEAMTAFIALMIAFLVGNYDLGRPLGPAAPDHFLSINIGIPVAARDDKITFGAYSKMLGAARDLAAIASELTLDDVRTMYGNARPGETAGFKLIPELVAALSAYAADPTAPEGAHILIDVGASTLDIVAFNMMSRTQTAVFTACVELLGAAALDEARAQEISDEDFKRACDEAFERVYGGARHLRRAPSLFHPSHRRRHVQLVVTGGGCRTDLHAKFIEEMTKARVLGAVPLIDPSPPAAITDADCDKKRLLLAYGLTLDVQELLALRLPSEIDDLPPRDDGGPQMISNDDV